MPGADHPAISRLADTPGCKCPGPPVQAYQADSGRRPAVCLCHMISALLSILGWPERPPSLPWPTCGPLPGCCPPSELAVLISALSVQDRPTTPASLPAELPRPKTRLRSRENILDSWWIDDPSLTSLYFRGFVPGVHLSLG